LVSKVSKIAVLVLFFAHLVFCLTFSILVFEFRRCMLIDLRIETVLLNTNVSTASALI